jgi:hypothetical protein
MNTGPKKAAGELQGASVYISGSISADLEFKPKFDSYEAHIMQQGAARCLNPTIFPLGWHYSWYMEHCLIMVRHADTIAMLPCWEISKGAKAELAYAQSLGLRVVYLDKLDAAACGMLVDNRPGTGRRKKTPRTKGYSHE